MVANPFRRDSLLRFILASAAFMVLVPNAISAYTLVMRDGRRIQIPDDFSIDRSSLTYRVSDSIQVTLQLSAIDTSATEQLNGETPIAFWQHRLASSRTGTTVRPRSAKSGNAVRSITNQDLESYRRTRIESERNYEKRRLELGLPKVEEQRRALAAVGERASEEASNIRSKELDTEMYWRNRADTLRNDISATNAQIEYINSRLQELPASNYGPFGNMPPFTTLNQLSVGPPFFNTTFGTQTVIGPQFRGRFGYPNNRFRYGVNTGFRRYGQNPFYSPFPLVNVPYQNYDYSYERSNLIHELDQLMSQKVALQSRWRDFEEEARKAGAYPGWLRPR
jgi:hypothetical protein